MSRHVKKERFGNMFRVLVHAYKIRGGSSMVPSVPSFVPVHANYIVRAYARDLPGYKLNCLPWLLNKLLEKKRAIHALCEEDQDPAGELVKSSSTTHVQLIIHNT